MSATIAPSADGLTLDLKVGGVTRATLSSTGGLTVPAAAAAGDAVRKDQLNAATGHVGEVIENYSAGTSATSSASYFDVTSISLSTGVWDVRYNCSIYNGSSGSATYAYAGIGTSAGTSDTGVVSGDTRSDYPTISVTTSVSSCIPSKRYVLASPAILYLKGSIVYTGTAPSFSGRITAERVAL